MTRLQDNLLTRIEAVYDPIVHDANIATMSSVPRRLTDQLLAAGTSDGANAFGAHEAISPADFGK